MKFALMGIYDRGNLQMERLHFKLLADFDLRFFVVIEVDPIVWTKKRRN
jgi:hypothetical protein